MMLDAVYREGKKMAYQEAKHSALIAETAVELFKKNGYESVSVNEICKAAGLSRSSFYATFSGKRDIIDYVLNQSKMDERTVLDGLMDADNDFERMWILCDRYLDIVYKFGPELTGALLRLELSGYLDNQSKCHGMDDWFIRLMRNCQKNGVILSEEKAEILVPMVTDAVYMDTYNWCRLQGKFSLRQRARRTVETLYHVAPEYRWSDEQLNALK